MNASWLFIHLLMDGYFGCFQVLAIMNKSTKISTHRFSCVHVLNSSTYLKDWLLDCVINLHLLLLKTAKLSSKTVSFFIPTCSEWGFLLFHILRSRYCQFFFNLSYINSRVVVSRCCLVCNSLVTCNVRYLFICIFAIFICYAMLSHFSRVQLCAFLYSLW